MVSGFTGRTLRVADPPRRKEPSSLRSAMPGARFMTWSTQAPHSLRPCPSSATTTSSGSLRVLQQHPKNHLQGAGQEQGPKSGKPSGTSLQKAVNIVAGKGRGPLPKEARARPQTAKARASGRTHGPSRTPRGKHFAET